MHDLRNAAGRIGLAAGRARAGSDPNLIAQGKDKDQIKDALVAQYGPRVLATPSGHGFDLLAWLVPGIGILLAAGAVAYGLRRTLRQTSRGRPEPQPLDPGDAARLEADLSRHEL